MNDSARKLFGRIISNSLVAGVAMASAMPTALSAQASDWAVFVGTGTVIAPAFVGSDVYQVSVLPNLAVARSDRFRASLLNGAELTAIQWGGFRLGPVLRYDGGRDEHDVRPWVVAGGPPDAVGLGDVSGTVELGGVAAYTRRGVTAGIEVRRALSGHRGIVGQAGLTLERQQHVAGRHVRASIGPIVTVADTDYGSAYFGVDEPQSARTGLPTFDAGAGLMRYGLRASLTVTVNERLSVISFGAFDRIGSDRAESPIVRLNTRHSQAFGTFVNFRVK